VRDFGPLVTVLRPSWITGPGDRMLPRLVRALRAGWSSHIGSPDDPLNLIAADDVAQGAVLAADHAAAAGQAYNLCCEGMPTDTSAMSCPPITQRAFFDIVTTAVGLPPVCHSAPYWLAYSTGWLSEVVGRLIRIRRT
jgi:nucleoside-diphosphate-sugar epimerase